MPSLNSSNLGSAEWTPSADNPEFGMLTITFKSGKTYRYAQVPQDTYRSLLEASSAGKYFNEAIKDTYSVV